MSRPPCWPVGQPCPNPCAAALYDRTVYNRQHLSGPWTGWRMAGRELVSPDGDRITPERLRGLLWRQASEQRLAQVRARNRRRVSDSVVTVLRVRNSDWHRERFGSSAG